MEKLHAVLLDAASIQSYVFGSNKLKENIGASFIVEEIYRSILTKAIKEALSPSISLSNELLEKWKELPHEFRLIKKPDEKVEIGYIGGGNALIFFTDKSEAINFVKKWTQDLLIDAPGLSTCVAFGEFEVNEDKNDFKNFAEDKKSLFEKLVINKNAYHRETVIPRHGITAICKRSGLSMECEYGDEENKLEYISSVANGKLAKVPDANKRLQDAFEELLKDKFLFPFKLDDLGQKIGDSHIAIVHIDGNNIGKKFAECQKIEELRKLSCYIKNRVKKSMEHIIKKLVKLAGDDENRAFEEIFELKTDKKSGKKFLPIRPIVYGGDDVTFVCDGRLGVFLAEKFMKVFHWDKSSESSFELSSCSGISIIKTKYPFYRGYQLAESLCKKAKREAKEDLSNEGINASWLDFHIAYGGFSGSLEMIRDKHYKIVRNNKNASLLLRPYRISPHNIWQREERNFDPIKNGMKHFMSTWPTSKVHELLRFLSLDDETEETFIKGMRNRGHKLPDSKNSLWEHKDNREVYTQYFDMIELMEFYPEILLQCSLTNVETL
ncbi:MAG: hypothetical protein K8T10_19935 [Candidatus Eremiobacteraeota bacterium]|nr:hypothetical protein [Candidatus Eremiobacteraeota bacterium]